MILRIDDLEGPRVKAGADLEAIEDLRWLGLDWAEESPRQSTRSPAYQAALDRLVSTGLAYPCVCTRSEVAAAADRVSIDGSLLYPGTCRGRYSSIEAAARETGRSAAIRFRAAADVAFEDELLGRQQFGPDELGDFVLRKSDGEFGYQLACVVDDAEARITHIVRGHDLLASTPRQILVYRALGLERSIPSFIHLPLIVGPDGRKLAKRHGDTRIRQLREEGISAGRVRAMLARWSGFEPSGEECGIEEWVEKFDLSQMPRSAIVYDDAVDRPRP